MVFKKPGNSRDDRSNKTSGSYSKGSSDRKNASSSRSKSAGQGFGKTDGNGPKKRYGSDAAGDRKPFAARGKSNFGSNSAEDRPKKHYGSDAAGDRKPFAARGKSNFGNNDSEDRPKKHYNGPSTGGRKPLTSGTGASAFDRFKKPAADGSRNNEDRRNRSFGGAPSDRANKSFDDRPKRKFSDEGSEGKSFAPRSRSNSDAPGERKFAPKGRPASGDGDNKFGRSGDKPAFRKPADGDFKDKPFRKNDGPREDRPSRERSFDKAEEPTRTMRGRKKPAEGTVDDKGLIRLNRYISNAGICSRRKADELIVAGVVSVNGEVVSELGFKVDPMVDVIRYNGETLKREKMVYVLLNKPKDYITTTDDPQERRTVMNLVEKASRERIYPVGRLDRNTTGLLLMTNDGDLADKLSHPRNSIVKLYQVELNKALTQGDLNKIGFGLELEDGLIKPDSISYVTGGTKKEVGIQIHSGKNRIVRRIFEHLGYDVVKLDRAVYANLNKKDLPRGRWRYLDEKEVIQLKHLIK